MKFFSNETLFLFFRKSWASYNLNLVAAIDKKLWNERALECKSTGEPCTCEYVTLLQSFHRDTLSMYWYIAQKF